MLLQITQELFIALTTFCVQKERLNMSLIFFYTSCRVLKFCTGYKVTSKIIDLVRENWAPHTHGDFYVGFFLEKSA